MDREIWKLVYKMAAGGRTEVSSDVKFGPSSSSTSGPNLVIVALMVSQRWSRHDDGDDDGVYAAYPINAFANSVGLGRLKCSRGQEFNCISVLFLTPEPKGVGEGVYGIGRVLRRRRRRRRRCDGFSVGTP